MQREGLRIGGGMLLVAALVAQALAAASVATNTGQSSGKVGVYCRLDDVVGNPEALRRTMTDIKAAGIDFILPYAKYSVS